MCAEQSLGRIFTASTIGYHYNYLLQFSQNIKICVQTFLAFEVKKPKLHSNNEQMCGKLSLGWIFTASTICYHYNPYYNLVKISKSV